MPIDLKAYTTRAKDLEAAIYTHTKLMETYDQVIKTLVPVPPEKYEADEPVMPEQPTEPVSHANLPKGVLIFTICVAAFFFYNWIASMTNRGNILIVSLSGEFIWFLGFVICASIVAGILKNYLAKSKEYREQYAKYQKDMNRYYLLLEEYNQNFEKYQEEQHRLSVRYQIAYSNYTQELEQYNRSYIQAKEKQQALHTLLVSVLDNLYAQNIIYPKYRHFVAISAINEYLDSGRCDKLEGADGAYNLFELELYQKIIIDQLSTIIINLEQIKNNQYLLYQELKKSNSTVEEIMYELQNTNDNTKLLAYYSRVTALASIYKI